MNSRPDDLDVNPDIYKIRKHRPKFNARRLIGYIGLENLKFARNVKNTNIHLDLTRNMDNAILKEEGLDVKITELLKYLLENEIRLNLSFESALEKARFFCFRGLLSLIACTPYEKNELWKIVAVLHKGTIYLCRRKTEEQLQNAKNMSPYHKKCTFGGYKFEQYMLSDTPSSEPNTEIPLDANKEFSLVFSARLNQHRIFFGAEMDGIKCDNNKMAPLPLSKDPEVIIKYLSSKEFIELKTCQHLDTWHQRTNFWKFKAMKWWCQSFFAGVNEILCGFRDRKLQVQELRVYRLSELCSKSKDFWTPEVCLNFLDTFLCHVKKCLANEIRRIHGSSAVNNLQKLPLIAIKLEWTPGSSVTMDSGYKHEDDPILEDWFLEQYGKHRNYDVAHTSGQK